MKCSSHNDIDAVSICVNCGKGVCAECKTALRGRSTANAVLTMLLLESSTQGLLQHI